MLPLAPGVVTPRWRRVLWIGLSDATWQILSPLIDQNVMPRLASLCESGVMAYLRAYPYADPALFWTTIATGTAPTVHNIATSCHREPSRLRQAPAIWNRLHHVGLRLHVAGWPASHPAEPLRGVHLSDRFPVPQGMPGYAWPLDSGAIHPPSRQTEFAALRMSATEFAASDLLPLLPELRDIDEATDRRPMQLADLLARNASIHAAATRALESEPWDFAAIHYPALSLAHGLPGHTIREVCRFLDSLLARLCELAGPDALLMLMSSPPASPAGVPEMPAPGLLSSGIFLLAGPGIRADEWLPPVSPLELVPMTLTAFQLPAGAEGVSNHLHPAEPPGIADAIAAQEAQLECEGYAGPDASKTGSIAGAHEYALGVHELLQGRTAEARTWLQSCTHLRPQPAFPHVVLAYIHFLAGDHAAARALAALFPPGHELFPFAEWIRANLLLAEGSREEAGRLFAAHSGQPLLRTLEGDHYRFRRLWLQAETAYRAVLWDHPSAPGASLGLLEILIRFARYREASSFASTLIAVHHQEPRFHLYLGIARYRTGQHAAALRALRTAHRLLPESPAIRRWLARAEAAHAAA